MPFLDLAQTLRQITSKAVTDRIEEFTHKVPKGVYVAAVGGFPITENDEGFSWCGSSVTPADVSEKIQQALGLSGLLTYMNRSRLSTMDLGRICLEKGHDWGGHWVTLSLLFVGYDPKVELSVTRDRKFWMSWPIQDRLDTSLFMATGSLKSWSKFVGHRDNADWDAPTRLAMADAADVVNSLTSCSGHGGS